MKNTDVSKCRLVVVFVFSDLSSAPKQLPLRTYSPNCQIGLLAKYFCARMK